MAVLSGFADEERALQELFEDNYSASPIKWDNAPIEDDLVRGVGYVAFFILNGDSQQISLGTHPVDRHPGVVVIQSFTPENEGSRAARERFDLIDPIFKRKELVLGNSGLIRMRVPSMTRVGTNDGWYQSNIEIPYIRDVQ